MELQKTLKNSAITIIVGAIISILSVFILQFIYFGYDFERTIVFFDYQTRLNLLQSAVVFVLFLWFYFLTTSKLITSVLILITSIIIGIANEQKILFRSEPVYPSDVHFIKDIPFLFEMVDVKIGVIFIGLAFFILSVFIVYLKKRKKKSRNKFHYIFRISGLALTSLALLYVNQFNQPGNKVKDIFSSHAHWISYSQHNNYRDNGVVSGLLYNLKSPAVDKPVTYNRETIEEIYEKYAKVADSINEERSGLLEDYNLIFVMNETFSDPLLIDGIEISEDPIPFFREMSEQHLTGMSLSQGYGGGTANIEFEALTSISLEPLTPTITTPFIQLSNQISEFPKITDVAKKSGHFLTAIHPYNSSMYKRKDNYKALGFEKIIFEEDLKAIERIDQNNFISDKTAYTEVLETLTESNQKDFIHVVTMNNHKPHVNKYDQVEFKVEGAPYNLEVAHYAKGIQHSDKEFADFTKELDKHDEKTIVVFWGDHLPSFYGEYLFNLNGHLTMHETPLLFYTNFEGNKSDIGTISPIFFINHILEMTNSKVTPFTALLGQLEKVLPAFEKGIYLERETYQKTLREELRPSVQLTLKDYETILYDITTGKNYSKELGFY
ncbi:sulfatase-like hydrolase/transferase [Jeotgalibaca porci]|uniref:Sulfatase-like hydrolase/transferase n=1 Tax=Jeotgalibaca porci TaxID=1868793 RepID=A0A6G7WG25_9LACT|nr:alkaline phosphatase family protein [Jeotgalibaca porci]QIK51203.1 sulfatase-like hydrolase/transferase [Jeotgalibaca porci]